MKFVFTLLLFFLTTVFSQQPIEHTNNVCPKNKCKKHCTIKINKNSNQVFVNCKTDSLYLALVINDVINKNNSWFNSSIGGHILQALLTVLVALVLFIIYQMYFKRRDRNIRRKEYNGLLRILADDVMRNLNFECQLNAYVFVGIEPSFKLSFLPKDLIFKDLVTISDNYLLLNRIFTKYYELKHIQDRVNEVYLKRTALTELISKKIVSGPEFDRAKLMCDDSRDGTTELIRGNIRGTFELYNEIVNEIEANCKKNKLKKLNVKILDELYDKHQNENVVMFVAKQENIDLTKRNKFY